MPNHENKAIPINKAPFSGFAPAWHALFSKFDTRKTRFGPFHRQMYGILIGKNNR